MKHTRKPMILAKALAPKVTAYFFIVENEVRARSYERSIITNFAYGFCGHAVEIRRV